MTVGELIAQLQEYPQDFIVIQASDEEGNDFNEAYDLGYGYWDKIAQEYTSWTVDTDEDNDIERELTLDESNSVCIWP